LPSLVLVPSDKECLYLAQMVAVVAATVVLLYHNCLFLDMDNSLPSAPIDHNGDALVRRDQVTTGRYVKIPIAVRFAFRRGVRRALDARMSRGVGKRPATHGLRVLRVDPEMVPRLGFSPEKATDPAVATRLWWFGWSPQFFGFTCVVERQLDLTSVTARLRVSGDSLVVVRSVVVCPRGGTVVFVFRVKPRVEDLPLVWLADMTDMYHQQ
ncbi:hypothetical protein Taro_032206, partial [Colocasia esculenta]|nr:hypothetical protein [Colocasia esculenta]